MRWSSDKESTAVFFVFVEGRRVHGGGARLVLYSSNGDEVGG